MKIKCKKEMNNSSKFTIGNIYSFELAKGIIGDVYEIADDKGELWCIPTTMVFEYFTFDFKEV